MPAPRIWAPEVIELNTVRDEPATVLMMAVELILPPNTLSELVDALCSVRSQNKLRA